MKPWEVLDKARAPGGAELRLTRRGDEYAILADGRNLMSSRMHASEDALAELGCAQAQTLPKPVVLVGGLGMGYTLRATLDLLPRGASVVVSELVPALVEWNRGPLSSLAKAPLADRRVSVELGDVLVTLRGKAARFDAILLDVDNGPSAFTTDENGRLYTARGIEATRASLRPGGTLAVWSASEDRAYERRLQQAGFTVETQAVRGRKAKGAPTHFIFVARAPR